MIPRLRGLVHKTYHVANPNEGKGRERKGGGGGKLAYFCNNYGGCRTRSPMPSRMREGKGGEEGSQGTPSPLGDHPVNRCQARYHLLHPCAMLQSVLPGRRGEKKKKDRKRKRGNEERAGLSGFFCEHNANLPTIPSLTLTLSCGLRKIAERGEKKKERKELATLTKDCGVAVSSFFAGSCNQGGEKKKKEGEEEKKR